MNIMNMPGFTAETSLYKTSRHYQTARKVVHLPTHMIGAISPAKLKEESEGVNCDTCLGAQCVELHCLEKMTHAGGDLGGLDPGGGGGGGSGPVEPCLDHDQCGVCFPVGPSIFSGGRKFCQSFTCQPTSSGGCSCQVYAKGYQSCDPVGDRTTTRARAMFTRG